MSSVISLRNVVVTLNGFPALSGLDLDVSPGELLVVRGPNGAGKTTLLRTCGGLLPVSSGSAEVLGHDLSDDRRSLRREVGLLSHANFLSDDLTVEDNIRFAVRANRGDSSRIPSVLTHLGLDGRLANLRAGACSAGQRRRTALAALVVRQPRLWLLDEPHAGLDADSRDLLDAMMRAAIAGGATVLLSSHETDRASALATRTITVAGGFVTEDSAEIRRTADTTDTTDKANAGDTDGTRCTRLGSVATVQSERRRRE